MKTIPLPCALNCEHENCLAGYLGEDPVCDDTRLNVAPAAVEKETGFKPDFLPSAGHKALVSWRNRLMFAQIQNKKIEIL